MARKPADKQYGKHSFKGVRYDKNGNPIYTSDTLSDDEKKAMGWRYSKKHGLHGQVSDPSRFNESKNTIRLTENELKEVIAESVKRILNEGIGWETFKDIRQNLDGQGNPNWKEFKELVKGEPNAEKFKQSKGRYDAAKAGTLYDPEAYEKQGGMDGMKQYAAGEATWSEPGLKGKMRRGAIGVGAIADNFGKKIRNRFSK